jgi:hypothetical protein
MKDPAAVDQEYKEKLLLDQRIRGDHSLWSTVGWTSN